MNQPRNLPAQDESGIEIACFQRCPSQRGRKTAGGYLRTPCPARRNGATTASDTLFFATRPVLPNRRKIRLVARSSLSTRKRLTASWIGASTVAQKRVPIVMPSAPSASAATSPAPIGKAAARKHRQPAPDRQRPGSGPDRHIVFAGMAGAFEPSIEIAFQPIPLGRKGMADGGAFVDPVMPRA